MVLNDLIFLEKRSELQIERKDNRVEVIKKIKPSRKYQEGHILFL